MKAFLLHRDHDFPLDARLPADEESLSQDLELDTLWSAMAAGDELLFKVTKRVLLQGLREPDEIVYRQQVLSDAIENAGVVRQVYELAGEALTAEKRIWGGLSRNAPRSALGTSVQKLELLVGSLRQLREITYRHAASFRSPGLTRFFSMLTEELDEPYFELIESQLKALKFKRGMLLSAQLTGGNKGAAYMLRVPREQGLVERVLDRSGYSFTIPERDDSGFRALGELEDRGANLVANALAQSLDHVKSFFTMLRIEIGFYVACINLSEHLARKGEPVCLPEVRPADDCAFSARGLYDVCLALRVDGRVVGNDVGADGRSLVVITGANQGGKSTFLRGVGVAQLMMQAGMFVGAESLRASVCTGVFTHYKREEDATMQSGKLDEELARMSGIADQIRSHGLLLCNESFASTNEREGSEIARQVIHAMRDGGIRVLFVTHMYDLASSFYGQELDGVLFLRAERGAGGARPFTLAEAEPLPTSYGEDSYRRVFGRDIGSPLVDQSSPGQPWHAMPE